MSDSSSTPVPVTCTLQVSPDAVDAGAELALIGAVSCAPPADLRGHTLLVRNQVGDDIGRLELTRFDGTLNETNEHVVKAPDGAGQHTWTAVCPSFVKKGISYAEASTSTAFIVKPHTTSIVVWDVPSAVVAGERFRMKVGIKCSCECDLSHTLVEIHDHEGRVVGTAAHGDRWSGTSALYAVEVELDAPAAEGVYTWTARTPSTGLGANPSTRLGAGAASEAKLPHAEGVAGFGVSAVPGPDCVVTVETLDKASRAPLSGARVVMHPYRAVTDERGIAEIRVARGAYKLFVSQTKYVTLGMPLEVTADTTTRAELDVEPVLERN